MSSTMTPSMVGMTYLGMECPYCGSNPVIVMGSYIYPQHQQYHHAYYLMCQPCNAYIRVSAKTGKPLGTLATKPTRLARQLAHKHFDALWKAKGVVGTRDKAYEWLAHLMDMEPQDCHMAYMDEQTALRVVRIVDSFKETFNP